jgi:nucleoside-diphosphate-sugar epimerase
VAEKIFVTGGAGFIGAALIRQFGGQPMTVYDNLSRVHPHTLSELRDNVNVTLIQGDILDLDRLSHAMESHALVVHCAAVAGVQAVARNPITTIRVNAVGSLNVLDSAVKVGVPRIVMLSTSETYGQAAANVNEALPTVIPPAGHPRWTYAASKLLEEHAAAVLHHLGKIKAMIVRPFNVYGPGQRGDGAIRNLLIAALRNEPLEVAAPGDSVRSWCYIDDFVRLLNLLLKNDDAWGKIINIGNSDSRISSMELAHRIRKHIRESTSEIRLMPSLIPDVTERYPDTSLMQMLTGSNCMIGLDEGLQMTEGWLRRFSLDPTL